MEAVVMNLSSKNYAKNLFPQPGLHPFFRGDDWLLSLVESKCQDC